MARVLIVMPGHLSTTPRMLKAADSLHGAGHQVRVVSGNFLDWARDADTRTAAARRWRWQVVDHSRATAPAAHARTGLRRRIAHALAVNAPGRASWWTMTRALSRAHPELVSAGLSEPCDLVYGGSVGGLAAVEEIARRAGVPFGIDLEDLHTAESVAPDAAVQHRLARRVLDRILPRAAFITTSSECMAGCYEREFNVRPAVLHNVFPLPDRPPDFERPAGPLRVYWFSQTIGPRRGIEDLLTAADAAGMPISLTVRGQASTEFARSLRARVSAGPGLTIHIEPPADPDRMIDLCRGFDVGLCGENQPVTNSGVALANKIFTYLAAGCAVALSDTPAHRRIAPSLGDAACVYDADRPTALAAWLQQLSASPDRLRAARRAAWNAAVTRWHWSHPEEEGRLLALAAAAVA